MTLQRRSDKTLSVACRPFFYPTLAALVVAACNPVIPAQAGTDASTQADAEADVKPAAATEAKDPLKLADGPLGLETLDAYAQKSLFYEPKDEFSPPAFDDSALVDREFVIEFPPSGMPLEGLEYRYDTKREVLRLWVSAVDADHFHGKKFRPDFDYLPFSHVEEAKTETGQNAFGASGNYTASVHYRFGVGVTSDAFKLGFFKKSEYGTYVPLEKELAISPDEGRLMAEGLKLRVRGTLRADPKYERVVACTKDQTTPTFDYPYLENWSECVLSADLHTIEIVSPSAGVLASWTQ